MLCNFYHPQVKDAVANDWEMENGNICIFTGSNMAGKSTTLKAIASAVWLAHAGFPVPASSMVCPMFDGIFYFYQSAGFSERWSQPFLCGKY